MSAILDLSGGYLEYPVTIGPVQHLIRVHVPPFTFGGTNPYVAPVAGREPDVQTTAIGFQGAIDPAYINTASVGEPLLTQQTSPGVFVARGGTGTGASSGSGGGPSSSPSFCAIFTYRTASGRFLKIEICTGVGLLAAVKTRTVPAGPYSALNAYILGGTTMVVGESGQRAASLAGLSARNNKRLFEKYRS